MNSLKISGEIIASLTSESATKLINVDVLGADNVSERGNAVSDVCVEQNRRFKGSTTPSTVRKSRPWIKNVCCLSSLVLRSEDDVYSHNFNIFYLNSPPNR